MFKSFEDMSIDELKTAQNKIINMIEKKKEQQLIIDNLRRFYERYPNTSMQLTVTIHGENHTINILGFLDRIEFKNHSVSS